MRFRHLILPAVILAGATVPAVQAAFSEDFAYPDGQLTAVSGGNWTTNAGNESDRIQVLSGVGQILSRTTSSVTPNNDAVRTIGVTASPAGLIQIDLEVLGGLDGGNHWSIEFQSNLNNNIARWYGSETTAMPRITGKTVATGWGSNISLSDTNWVKLRAVIDINANTTSFYQDTGSGMTFNVAIPHDNVGDDSVSYVLLRSNATHDPAHILSIDNMSVVPEPAALVLLSLGALGLRGRRRTA